MKVLIIEDNIVLSKNISQYLELEKIDNVVSNTSKDWLYQASTVDFDCIILDLNLYEEDWLEILEKLRNKWVNTPIIILTARNTLDDKIKWLEIWADDYMTKPFEYEELIARIKSSVRRTYSEKTKIIKIWDIKIDLDKKIATKDKKEITLTNLEYKLLEYLLHNKWKIVSKEQLLEKVWWDLESNMQSRTVDMFIHHLRKKLGKDIVETKKWLWYIIK